MKKALLIATLVFCAMFFVNLLPAFAAEQILDFSSIYTIRADGSILATESILYDFGTQQKHGIYRNIPLSSANGPTTRIEVQDVVDASGNSYSFLPSQMGGGIQIKIGDANKLISGKKLYRITYIVKNVVRGFGDHDEFYWNVTGNEWQVPILASRATVYLPTMFASGSVSMNCYVGAAGSTSTCQTSKVYADSGLVSATKFSPNQSLPPGEGFTITTGFPKGFVVEASDVAVESSSIPVSAAAYENPFRNVATLLRLIVLVMFLPGVVIRGIVRAFSGGRPKLVIPSELKNRPLVVQYEPPADLKPFDVGILMDNKLDPADISAAVISLAQRGYIKIHYIYKEIPFWPDKKDFEFELLKDGKDLESPSDKLILNTLFSEEIQSSASIITDIASVIRRLAALTAEESSSASFTVGSKVKLSEIGKAGATVRFLLRELEVMQQKQFEAQGLLERRRLLEKSFPAVYDAKYGFAVASWLCVILLLGAAWYFNFLALGAVIVFVIVTILMIPLRIFTEKGLQVYSQLMGFRKFLEMTEKDKLEMLNAPDLKPEVFEKYLPYAIALGVEDKWAERFKNITLTAPNWYEGGNTGAQFNSVVFAHTFAQASTMFAAATSAGSYSSGGSGGGGFSGGGSGGGGGGSW